MPISDRPDETTEQAARVIIDACKTRRDLFPATEPISVQAARQYAQALADAGLLAPAPLTEVRAENQYGETHRRWATDWERHEKDHRG